MKFQQVVRCFEQAGHRVELIQSQQGCIACIAAGARVIAFAPDPEAESFLFNPEQIADPAALRDSLYCADGAPGGDRLWIAPENNYFRPQQSDQYVDHSGHRTPPAIDPGDYSMRGSELAVEFNAEIAVKDFRNNVESSMAVQRRIQQIASPFEARNVATASYQLEQSLEVHTGYAGLWNITQVPKGGVVVVPLKSPNAPTNYFAPSAAMISDNACAFYLSGDSQTKIGYGWQDVTGHSATFHLNGATLSMLYRDFPVVESGDYCDFPIGQTTDNQVLQAWDGFGFGEMEYHSVAAGNTADKQNEKRVHDQSRLHGVRGETELVLQIACEVLRLPSQELREIVARL